MVMEMPRIFGIACVLCLLAVVHCETVQETSQPEQLDESSVRLLGSLFGFKPCLDDSCEAVVQPADTVEESSTGGKYEQPNSDTIPPGSHTQLLCAAVKASSLLQYREVEARHEGFSVVKARLIEEIISYAHTYSSFYDDKCSVEMKFLDLFILAASELRKEYTKMRGGNCSYTFEEGSEWPVLPEERAPCASEDTTVVSVTSAYVPSEVGSTTPCPIDQEYSSTPQEHVKTEIPDLSTKTPCPEEFVEDHELEVIAEEDEYAPIVGSVRGIPGIHYPNYTDVPITSFSCADKHIPGFYADLETGCQVFHVCYEHRRESFLCPVGTIFNQPILACDYWYSSNCSLAPAYFEVNVDAEEVSKEEDVNAVKEMISVIVHETGKGETTPEENVLDDIAKFLPVKAKVTEYPGALEIKGSKKPAVQDVEDVATDIFNKIIVTATDVSSDARVVIEKLPQPIEKVTLTSTVPLTKVAAVKTAVPIFAKAKFAAAALPLAAAKVAIPVAKIAATKAAIPVLAKAKVAAAIPAAKVIGVKAAIPVAKVAVTKAAVPVIAKAKVAAAIPAVKVIGAKAVAAPVLAKGKLAGVAVPAAKVTAAKVAIPVITKAKLAATVPAAAKVAAKVSIPALKAKMVASAVPLAKTKLAAPAFKAKVVAAATIPLVKPKVIAVPLVKSKLAVAAPLVTAKLAKSAAISPITKKALALGYMKLLKAKKLALMG